MEFTNGSTGLNVAKEINRSATPFLIYFCKKVHGTITNEARFQTIKHILSLMCHLFKVIMPTIK